MKIFNSINFCVNAAHQGHAQASVQITGNTINIVLDENETNQQGEKQ